MVIPPKGTPSANGYGFLNQIQDRATRDAIKKILDQLTSVQEQLQQGLGQLTQPLTQSLIASNNQLKRLADPSDPQDAVTLRYLQEYVANFASAFSGTQAAAGGGEGEGDVPPSDGIVIPDHLDVVTNLWNASPLGPSSTDVELYRFVQAVAYALETVDFAATGLTCGLLYKPTGAARYDCSGISYSISRVCYDNGHAFKVLIDADPGGSRLPCWADNGGTDETVYRPVSSSGSC